MSANLHPRMLREGDATTVIATWMRRCGLPFAILARVVKWLRQNMPQQQQGRMRFLLDTLQRVVGGYLCGQLLLCGLLGLLVGVGMQLIGVPYALLLGVLAFIFGFIPVVGTLISGALCVLLALPQGWISAGVVLVYFVVVHIIEGDVVGPRIVGQSIGLHPVVSLAALLAGAELFGIGGAWWFLSGARRAHLSHGRHAGGRRIRREAHVWREGSGRGSFCISSPKYRMSCSLAPSSTT